MSNACLSLSVGQGVWGSFSGGCLASPCGRGNAAPHLLHCHLVNVRSGPILEADYCSSGSLSPVGAEMERRARPRRGLRNTCLL